jgi:hypothetical protein
VPRRGYLFAILAQGTALRVAGDTNSPGETRWRSARPVRVADSCCRCPVRKPGRVPRGRRSAPSDPGDRAARRQGRRPTGAPAHAPATRTSRQSPMKRPASSRLAQRHQPLRSQYSTRICVARRLTKANSCPFSGSCCKPWRASAYSPSNEFLMSTGAPYRNTRIRPSGKNISGAPVAARRRRPARA